MCCFRCCTLEGDNVSRGSREIRNTIRERKEKDYQEMKISYANKTTISLLDGTTKEIDCRFVVFKGFEEFHFALHRIPNNIFSGFTVTNIETGYTVGLPPLGCPTERKALSETSRILRDKGIERVREAIKKAKVDFEKRKKKKK